MTDADKPDKPAKITKPAKVGKPVRAFSSLDLIRNARDILESGRLPMVNVASVEKKSAGAESQAAVALVKWVDSRLIEATFAMERFVAAMEERRKHGGAEEKSL